MTAPSSGGGAARGASAHEPARHRGGGAREGRGEPGRGGASASPGLGAAPTPGAHERSAPTARLWGLAVSCLPCGDPEAVTLNLFISGAPLSLQNHCSL